MIAYVYKLINIENKLVYIGSTQNIKSRIIGHFTRQTVFYNPRIIPMELMTTIRKCFYVTTESMADALVLEAFLISKYKPIFNKQFKTEDRLTLNIDASKYKWEEFIIPVFDNPAYRIRVWKNDELLYEIPKMKEYYKPLFDLLGVESDMDFVTPGYGKNVSGYLIKVAITRVRRKNKYNMLIPKYEFLGQPEDLSERIKNQITMILGRFDKKIGIYSIMLHGSLNRVFGYSYKLYGNDDSLLENVKIPIIYR